jgi:hypothetical protein
LTAIKTLNEREIERQKQEKEKLQKTINEQPGILLKINQDHQQEQQKNNFTKYKAKMEHDHQGELEEQKNTISTAMDEKRKQDTQKFETERSIYEEQTKSLKNEIQTLKEEVTTSYWKGVGIGAAGGGIVGVLGTLVYQKYISPRSNAPHPVIVDSRKTITGTPVIPVLQEIRRQPDISYRNSGATHVANTSGNFSSGLYPTYGYNPGAEYTDSLNQQDSAIPDTQGTSGEVTVSTYTSGGTIQTSGIGNTIHVESMDLGLTLPISQATSHYYVPPSPITPVYFYRQFTPVPSELIGPYGWIPIKKMDWKQSTPFLGWLFEQIGYKVPRRPKSHDQGGDILLEGFGEKIVIQVKHRMENTGRKALEEALYAKKMHGATKARVISFSSPFTQEALNDVEKSEIELWDLERIIAEMRKHNIYYPID